MLGGRSQFVSENFSRETNSQNGLQRTYMADQENARPFEDHPFANRPLHLQLSSDHYYCVL